MADLFKALKPERHLSKSGFDLSQKHVFSSKGGQAVPVLALETVPDDYFEIDLMSLTRTMTLNTAAFLRGKMRYDFFFVPNSQLWHPFNQFISQRSDKHSTNQKGTKFCPNVSLSNVLSLIYAHRSIASSESWKDIHGYNWAHNAVRLLDMLGYGNHAILLDEDVPERVITEYINQNNAKYVNIFRLAAYQHIWYDFYRNKFYDTGDSGDASSVDVGDYVSYFNFDDVDCSTVANSHLPFGTEAEQNRIRGLLGMRYVQWKKDLFTSALPGQQFGVVSAIDMPVNLSQAVITGNGDSIGSLDSGNVDGEGTLRFSGDDSVLSLNGGLNAVSVQRTSAGIGKVVITNNSQPFDIDLYGTLGTVPNQNVVSLDGSISGLSLSGSPSASFDVLSLYKAQMLQNWKQATLRAGNMTNDNFMAHFGVTPRYEGDENVDYLGSFDSSLQINAVTSTATTGESINGKVGELGATGTAVTNGRKITYKSRDFGIIMCIASILPESEYNSVMLDKANTLLEEFDYFTPEFENIGLEAIPFSQYNNNGPSTLTNLVVGYAPRYWMYKTALDKVHGEFADVTAYLTSNPDYSVQGSLIPWVTPRTAQFVASQSGTFARKLSTFYVQPNVFDNVFGVRADSSQATDEFLHNVFFDIKAIRPMSVLGLPQF